MLKKATSSSGIVQFHSEANPKSPNQNQPTKTKTKHQNTHKHLHMQVYDLFLMLLVRSQDVHLEQEQPFRNDEKKL